MKHPLRLLAYSSFVALSVILTNQSVKAQSIPLEQQRPPATLEKKYPYRPSCLQLIPQLSATNPSFTAWGPVIGGKHQSWYGLTTGMDINKAITQLDALGLCVKGGEVVPWQAISNVANTTITSDATPLERNVQRLKNAPNRTDTSDTGAGTVVFLALLAAGSFWLLERFENKPWMQRLMGEPVMVPVGVTRLADAPASTRQAFASPAPSLPAANELPDRISQEELQAAQDDATHQQKTALSVLIASPFVSRAFYGFQRTGKTNLVASAMQHLMKQGITIYSLNLNSYGTADSIYWQGCRAVHGDLTYITDPDKAKKLIKRATDLVDAFMDDRSPSILVVDEWAPMTASYAYV